jgi:AcrR family transcriptional regulator
MAPRGRWDRTATAAARTVESRRVLVIAAARSLLDRGRAVTVSDVVQRAGVGRNTFYVHFDDLPAAFAAAEAEALTKISRALAPAPLARTPLERFRHFASEWLSIATTEPELVSLVIRGDGTLRGCHVELRKVIENALRAIASSARRAGVLGRPADPNRLRALTGAFVAFAERAIEENGRIDHDRLAGELVEFSLRALR